MAETEYRDTTAPTPPDRRRPGETGLLARGLKLRQLALLAAIDRTGQVAAAAQTLNMTQPAASRMLAQLEAAAGVALTERLPRGVRLTGPGRRLADSAHRILGEIDEAARAVADLDGGRVGVVAFGSVSGPSLELVLPVLQNLRLIHPGIVPEITVDASDGMVAHLLSGRLEFYIGRIPDGADAGRFAIEPIGTEPLALIVRRGHQLDQRRPPALSDTLGFDWVMQPRGGLLRNTVEQYLLHHRVGLPARVVSTMSMMLTLAFVTRTNAVGTMSAAAADFFASGEGGGLPILRLPLAPDLRVSPYGIVTLRDRELTPAARTLRTALSHASRSMVANPG